MKTNTTPIVLAAALLAFTSSIHAQELVTNGTFDTGISGWTITGFVEDEWFDFGDGWPPFQGGVMAFDEAENFSISQLISGLVSGQEYAFSFSLALDGFDYDTTIFTVSLLDTVSNANLYTPFVFVSENWAGEYAAVEAQTFSTTFVADSSTATLSFTVTDSLEGLFLDNISIIPVPEPSGMLLVGLAGSLSVLRRRRVD